MTNPVLNRKQAPKIFNPLDFDFILSPIESFLLQNETTVYSLHDEQSNVVQLDFVFDAGNIYESHFLVALFCNQLFKTGTQNKSAKEIDELLEFYGVYLERSCSSETASLSIKVLSKHLEKVLPIINELLTQAVFPQSEIDLFINKSKQSLLLNLKKSDYIANKKINSLLFGNKHPYGREIQLSDYDNIKQADLLAFYEQFYVSGSCKIFVAGNLMFNIKSLLGEHFGNLPFRKKNLILPYPITPKANKNKIIVEQNKEAVQSSIRMGRLILHKQHPDFLKARVLNIVFGGYFGSRLMKEVREKRGYTYGIHSYIQNNKQECAWIIASETGKDVGDKALAAIHKEMKKLQNKAISEAELLLVKNFYLGIILGDIEGALPIMNIWKSLIMNGFDDAYFNANIETIKHITTTEIQALAIKYLDPNFFTTLLVH